MRSIFPPAAGRDVYADLLRDTRGMRRDHSRSREQWYRDLAWEDKEATLFELEMLLKGFACFANPRNHPGRPRFGAPAAHDYRLELGVVRDGLEQAVSAARKLLGEADRAYVFSRYLEVVMPEDDSRSQLINEQLTQTTPVESLFVLRTTFSSLIEIADAILQLERVPHRTYFGFLGMVTREVGRNVFFNPLVTLEFRPEFDRIPEPSVLEILHSTPEDAHKTAAVAFLTLFRARRYLQLVDSFSNQERTAARAYLILSVLRSDLRALTRFLNQGAADSLASGLERVLFEIPANEIRLRRDRLESRADRLLHLRGLLESMSTSLRVETRRVFEREVPQMSDDASADGLGPAMILAAAQLRATLHQAVSSLCHELRPDLVPPELGSAATMEREASERLRREIWMFRQIVRAFKAKAEAAGSAKDRWADASTFGFVADFLGHFRAIGYQLVRESDYDHLDSFLEKLSNLREEDFLHPGRSEETLREIDAIDQYLESLFQAISMRTELNDHAFDKRRAAETLKLYLQD